MHHLIGALAREVLNPTTKPKFIMSSNNNDNENRRFSCSLIESRYVGSPPRPWTRSAVVPTNVTVLLQLSDRTRIVAGFSNGSIKVISDPAMEDVITMVMTGLPSIAVTSLIELSRNRILSGSKSRYITLWNSEDGSQLVTLKDHYNSVNCLLKIRKPHYEYSEVDVASGKEWFVASSAKDETIKLWRITAGGDGSKCLKSLSGHSDDVRTICELYNGTIASGSLDKRIKIWNLQTGRASLTLLGHKGSVVCVIEIRRMVLLSASYDRTFKRWDALSGDCLQTIAMSVDWPYLINDLAKSAFHTFVAVSGDLRIRGWNEEGEHFFEVSRLPVGRVSSLASASKGRVLVGLVNGTIEIWEVPFV